MITQCCDINTCRAVLTEVHKAQIMNKVYDLCPKCFTSLQEFITERLPNVGQTALDQSLQTTPYIPSYPNTNVVGTGTPVWAWPIPNTSFTWGGSTSGSSYGGTVSSITTTDYNTIESWLETVKKQTDHQLGSITGKDVK